MAVWVVVGLIVGLIAGFLAILGYLWGVWRGFWRLFGEKWIVSWLERKVLVDVPSSHLDPDAPVTAWSLSYTDVSFAVRDLAEKAQVFQPDVIIGIDRGGAIVAGLLGKYLSRRQPIERCIVPLSLVCWRQGRAGMFVQASKEQIQDKKVLLVDDASRSGGALVQAKGLLTDGELRPADVRIAVILEAPGRPGLCNYSVYHAAEGRSPALPWDVK